VEQALSSKVLVITGGRGVGEGPPDNAILAIFHGGQEATHPACAPPAGPQADGRNHGLEAKPLHRLLEFDPAAFRVQAQAELPLECDLLVVDEPPMVNVPLMGLTCWTCQRAGLLAGG